MITVLNPVKMHETKLVLRKTIATLAQNLITLTIILLNNSLVVLAKSDNAVPQIDSVDLRNAYINAVINQDNTEELIHWLTLLERNNWQQGIESRDFANASKNKVVKRLIETLKSRVETVNHSMMAYTLEIPELIPEAIAFDKHRLFIGSLKQNAVYLIDPLDTHRFTVLGQPVYAIKYHQEKLWVLSNDLKTNNFVSIIDGHTGELLKQFSSSKPSEFNDLVFVNNTPYITDTKNDRIVTLPESGNHVIDFFKSKRLRYPNGIASDGQSLYIANSKGIAKLSLADKTLDFLKAPKFQSLGGIDGLYWFENSLIGIQNAIGQSRVIRINHLNDNLRVEVLETGNNKFDIPTTGEINDKIFYYIANSQLLNLGNEIPANNKTYILKIQM